MLNPHLHNLAVSLHRMSLPVTHAALCSFASRNAHFCAPFVLQRCITLSKYASLLISGLLQHTWSKCLHAACVYQNMTLELPEYACVPVSPLQALTARARTIPTLCSSDDTAFDFV